MQRKSNCSCGTPNYGLGIKTSMSFLRLIKYTLMAEILKKSRFDIYSGYTGAKCIPYALF